MQSVVRPSVIMLSVVMPSVIMLHVIVPSVIILSVVMSTVIIIRVVMQCHYAKCVKSSVIILYAECCYADCSGRTSWRYL
jgi:hypothetical protein